MNSDYRVINAIDVMYVKDDFAKGQEAFIELKKAADEGDGDACYLLGRCYSGSAFIDSRFNFEVNDELAEEYFNRSIEAGSALGMMGIMRVGGFVPRSGSLLHAPYTSYREVWDKVTSDALDGDLFSELLVANAYYYGDTIKLMELDGGKVTNFELEEIVRKFTYTAMAMYEDLYSHGMMMGYGNYKDIVTSGDYGIPKDYRRYAWLQQKCKAKGIDI